MLTPLNIKKLIFFSSFLFKIILPNKELKSEVKNKYPKEIFNVVKKIEKNIKIKKYSKRYFFEKPILRKTYIYSDKEKIKKIEEISTNETEDLYKDNYYFLNDTLYIIYEKYVFRNYVNIFSLPKDFSETKKNFSLYIIKKGKLIRFIEDNKHITNQKILIKEEEYIKQQLDQYIFLSKYLNLPNYRKYKGGPWGMRKRFPLCGKERALKLTYTFNKPIFIEIIDSNEERMYEIQEIPKKNKKTKIKRIFLILKNKKFDLDSIQISITSLAKGSEWDLKVEFEGDEIQIG